MYVNILYNIHLDFQNMRIIIYIQLLFIIIMYLYFLLNLITALNSI